MGDVPKAIPTSITVSNSKPSDFRCLKNRLKFLTGALVRIRRSPIGSRMRLMVWNAADTNAFMKRASGSQQVGVTNEPIAETGLAAVCNRQFGLVDQPR